MCFSVVSVVYSHLKPTKGLLYATNALVQLITLHSDVSRHDGVTSISLPAVSIIDYPDVANRGVLWSYRKDARSSSSNMRQLVELLSKLRINQLFLVIDTDEGDNADFNTAIAAKTYALDEVCSRHYVDLVPTVIITSANQRVSVDLLRNFSQKTIALFLLLEAPAAGDESESSCYDACKAAVAAIALAGFKSIILSASSYAQEMANPSVIAHRYDLTVMSYNIDDILNPSLLAKPLLCVQTTLRLLSTASLVVQVESFVMFRCSHSRSSLPS